MHQDVFAEVLTGQAQVDVSRAEVQGVGQLEEGKVVVVVIYMETFMYVQSPDRKVPLGVA